MIPFIPHFQNDKTIEMENRLVATKSETVWGTGRSVNTKEYIVVMEQFSIVILVVGTWIYTWYKVV